MEGGVEGISVPLNSVWDLRVTQARYCYLLKVRREIRTIRQRLHGVFFVSADASRSHASLEHGRKVSL